MAHGIDSDLIFRPETRPSRPPTQQQAAGKPADKGFSEAFEKLSNAPKRADTPPADERDPTGIVADPSWYFEREPAPDLTASDGELAETPPLLSQVETPETVTIAGDIPAPDETVSSDDGAQLTGAGEVPDLALLAAGSNTADRAEAGTEPAPDAEVAAAAEPPAKPSAEIKVAVPAAETGAETRAPAATVDIDPASKTDKAVLAETQTQPDDAPKLVAASAAAPAMAAPKAEGQTSERHQPPSIHTGRTDVEVQPRERISVAANAAPLADAPDATDAKAGASLPDLASPSDLASLKTKPAAGDAVTETAEAPGDRKAPRLTADTAAPVTASALAAAPVETPDKIFRVSGEQSFSLVQPAASSSAPAAPVTPPAQTLAAMPAHQTMVAAPEEIADIVASKLAGSERPDRVLVQLDPPELGRVSIEFKFDAQGLQHVSVTGNTPEAMKQLRLMHFDLVQSLEQNGLTARDMTFSQNSSQQGDTQLFQATPDRLAFLEDDEMAVTAARIPVNQPHHATSLSAGINLKL